MKYLVALLAFVFAHLIGAYLFWLTGEPFVRGPDLFRMAFASIIGGGTLSFIVIILWPDKKG